MYEIQELDADIQAVFHLRGYRLVLAEYNPKTGFNAVRVAIDSDDWPLIWSIRMGEIAHNLRSALDGLTYQLALLETTTPLWNVQFPIFLRGTTKRRRKPRPGRSGKGPLWRHFEKRGAP